MTEQGGSIEELERSLPDRLRATAEAMPLDPEALAAVRRRAGSARRRRRRTGVTLAGAAAAIALVAGGLVVLGDPASEGVTVAHDDTTEDTVAPVEADAVLVVYRYPNLPEPYASDPALTGEHTQLFVGDRLYIEDGPPDELGANSASEEPELAQAFAVLDRSRGLPAAEALRAVVERRGVALEEHTHAAGHGEAGLLFGLLSPMLTSGMATPEQAAEIRRLMESIPGATVTDLPDGSVLADSHTWTPAVVYDPATARPLRTMSSTAPESDIEFLSVERVRAADLLVPGRGTPASSPVPTTTPSTVVAGEPG